MYVKSLRERQKVFKNSSLLALVFMTNKEGLAARTDNPTWQSDVVPAAQHPHVARHPDAKVLATFLTTFHLWASEVGGGILQAGASGT